MAVLVVCPRMAWGSRAVVPGTEVRLVGTTERATVAADSACAVVRADAGERTVVLRRIGFREAFTSWRARRGYTDTLRVWLADGRMYLGLADRADPAPRAP
ncbi:hypothetical protein [Roseisolibacter sp. H3M3-2]|uniref:hypothetical protein n=1 Tax=Roseisolibacter sp. H3M3-2 TaxID=3031323 RepID=UPI0023DA4B08|nr:hypothetical protein [Roseisolibacter sp. H3M3-2]MDF1501792.1 hypothetical protein [Roseisolibacter sp. H3M3-2]